ncbi:MAG: exosortase-associated EpsI family protein [Planctomycetes bacterium]|nr:exosortase-associated EpsI family protein [Planctomycetota bacterium]
MSHKRRDHRRIQRVTDAPPPAPITKATKPALWVLAVGLALTAGSAAGYRSLSSNRLNPGPSVSQSGLDAIPTVLGDWTATQSESIDERALEMLETKTHWARKYSSTTAGASVEVMVLVGPSGPLAAHTPEVCYGTQRYELLENEKIVSVPLEGGASAEFRLVQLQPRQPGVPELRVLYGWNDGTGWRSPAWARVVYANTERIMKLQMAIPSTGIEGEPDVEFLKQLLPHLNRLVAPSETPET